MMQEDLRTKCIMEFYKIYPMSRKLVFDTFDQKKYHISIHPVRKVEEALRALFG